MKNRICIKFFTLVLLSATLLVSCADEEKGIVETQPSNEGKLTLKVSPTTRGDSENEIEKINSLRLILLDKDGKVKANILQTYPKESAEDFEETFEFDLALGEYKVYAIVNEESITNFKLEGREDVSNQTLSEVLNGYFYGNSGIEDFLNNIYFVPDYTKAIPYSSCYNITVDKEQVDKTIYLVPVANKLEINFFNYRNEEVTLKQVSIKSIADQNYLMAKIPEKYQYNGDVYWIDWLQEVSKDTTNHPELGVGDDSNDIINDNWGWLTHYELPKIADHNSLNLIKEGETWKIPKVETQIAGDPKPGLFSKKSFYYQESKYEPEESSSQLYTIEFKIDEDLVLTSEIYNLKTLFRNTYLIVNVEMTSEVDDIYVEILRWTKRDPVYGTIVPE